MKILGTLAGTVALAGTLALTAVPASAGTVGPAVSGDRRCVDWSVLYLRNYPAGQAFNQLGHDETFTVYEYRPSGWARGFAWGHVNSDRSGFAAPYDDIWVEAAALGKHVNDGSTC